MDNTIIERLLRPREVAEILALSQVEIYRMVRQGKLPAVVMGKSIRFRPGQIADYIDRHNKNSNGTDNGEKIG